MSLTELDLTALMVGALDGDADAYRRLLIALQTRLTAFFGRRLGDARSETEDLVQDTLMAVHVKRATFDRSQPVTAWVFAIARYKLIDHYRRTGRRRFTDIDDEPGLFADDASIAAEARLDLARGFDGLASGTRDLVVSVKIKEEPIADVARRTGLSEGAVKVAVHRGFRKLAERLGRKDEA